MLERSNVVIYRSTRQLRSLSRISKRLECEQSESTSLKANKSVRVRMLRIYNVATNAKSVISLRKGSATHDLFFGLERAIFDGSFEMQVVRI